MKCYIKYLKYILEHKKNVFIECWSKKMYLHAFTHDLSKFHPKEFFAYAKYFYLDKEKYKDEFKVAWQHHKDNNKHHWDYWYERNLDMPMKYVKQMLCDWGAMSRKFGGTPKSYYLNNRHEIKINDSARCAIEFELGLIDSACLVSGVTLDDYLDKTRR